MSQPATDVHIAKPTDISHRFEQAWNMHDMKAFGDLFHTDATFISSFGHYWRGREEIVERHRVIHDTIYRDSSIANRIEDVVEIDRHVAVVHVRCRIRVGRSSDKGPPEFGSRFTYVATRHSHHDGWLLHTGVNVNLVDPETNEQVAELPPFSQSVNDGPP